MGCDQVNEGAKIRVFMEEFRENGGEFVLK